MTPAVHNWQERHMDRHDYRGYHEIHLGYLSPVLREEEDEEEEVEEEEEEEEELMIEDASSQCSSPSIPDENINFDLVYALHTFVATVDGQASVVKGDTLILMDDSNIYWWLVKVLKTQEVGYIPAENIETPYERLARLNKHRNMDVTLPDIDGISVLLPPNMTRKCVTIAMGDNATEVIHYEVESDIEDIDSEYALEYISTKDNSDKITDHSQPDAVTIVECVADQTESTVDYPSEHSDDHHSATTTTKSREQDTAQETETLRVFAGNIGQGPLFHTFAITCNTTAKDLVQEALARFNVHADTVGQDTIEHYLAVQGSDGDDYVLSNEDKPLSIFKTLTASLTTPMPSVSHIHSTHKNQSLPSRRARSSSFSNYEQTDYDEDSVIRFYLHRRIKRAHEREGLIYIKVALYPDTSIHRTSSIDPNHGDSGCHDRGAFTTNVTPVTTTNKKKKHKYRADVDCMDKIMAVNREQRIGDIIAMALTKFHVPDATVAGYSVAEAPYHPHQDPHKHLFTYCMSVRAGGREMDLDPHALLSTVLDQWRPSPSQGPTSGLLFILHRADQIKSLRQDHTSVNSTNNPWRQTESEGRTDNVPEERRPSILDILMDSPRSIQDRMPSVIRDDRRPSLPSDLSNPEQSSVMENESRSLNSGNKLASATSAKHQSAPMSCSTVSDHTHSTATGDVCQHTEQSLLKSPNTKRRKEGIFRLQWKRLVGWGAKRKVPPSTAMKQPHSPPCLSLRQVSGTSTRSLGNTETTVVSTSSVPNTPTSPSANKQPLLASEPGTLRPPRLSTAVSTSETPNKSPSASLSSNSLPDSDSSHRGQSQEHSMKTNQEEISDQNCNSPSTVHQMTHSVSDDLQAGAPSVSPQHVASPTKSSVAQSPLQDKSTSVDTTACTDFPPSQPSTRLRTSPLPDSTSSSNASVTFSIDSTSTGTPSPSTSNPLPETPKQNSSTLLSSEPVTSVESSEMEDLLLLVTRGVDYLRTRESSYWDDQDGYKFHPWNRPESSFAVRRHPPEKISESVAETVVSQTEEGPPIRQDTTVPKLQTGSSSVTPDHASQPSASPTAGQPAAVSPANVSSQSLKKSKLQSSIVHLPTDSTASFQDDATLDEELQRIVAAHIVF